MWVGVFALDLIFVATLAIVMLSVISQVFIPLWDGIPLFPYFRRRKIEKKLSDAHEKVIEAQMEARVDAEKERLENFRQALREKSERFFAK